MDWMDRKLTEDDLWTSRRPMPAIVWRDLWPKPQIISNWEPKRNETPNESTINWIQHWFETQLTLDLGIN